MSWSLPDGFTTRPPTDADVPALVALMNAADAADGATPDMTEEDLRVWWAKVDFGHDARLVLGGDGEAAALLAMQRWGDDVEAFGFVHPAFRGRGLGTSLVGWSEQRAAELSAPRIRNVALTSSEAACRLLEARGYEPAHYFWRMRIDLPAPLADPRWPAGIEVGTMAEGEERRYHDAIDETFAEQWDYIPESHDEWRERKLRREHFDRSLWFLAREGDAIAGICQCSLRFGGGWVSAIGVRPAWRRRGIGLALLLHALHEFQRRGEPSVALGVDAQNPTGATRVYERAGMRVAWQAAFYEKSIQTGSL